MDGFFNWTMGSWLALGGCLLFAALVALAIAAIVMSLSAPGQSRDAAREDNGPRRLEHTKA